MNLYLYPAELDYQRSRPLAPTWHRIDSSVRDTEPPFELLEHLRDPRPLLYVSLGSLGSAEPELMGRLVDLLGRTDYRAIVSLGPQKGRLTLPENVWGDEYLPQPSLLPLVDAVITHGGNNTTTECMHFGKPMLVLPLFGTSTTTPSASRNAASATASTRTGSPTATSSAPCATCSPTKSAKDGWPQRAHAFRQPMAVAGRPG